MQIAKSISEGLASASALCGLIIMLLGVSDVVLRYAFNSPLLWAFETLTLLLLPTMFFLALAETYRRREHVFVDLVLQRLPEHTQRAFHRIGDVLSAILLTLICWGFVTKALEAYASEDVYVIADMDVPAWLKVATPIVGLIAAIITLLVGLFSREQNSDDTLSID